MILLYSIITLFILYSLLLILVHKLIKPNKIIFQQLKIGSIWNFLFIYVNITINIGIIN